MATGKAKRKSIPSARFKRIRKVYSLCSLITFNTILFLVLINLGLGILFGLKDWWNDPSRRIEAGQNLFTESGAPIQTGKRTFYQLDWFDVTPYDGIPREYAAEVLDDFFNLEQKGFLYQSWVGHSEPFYSGNRVNIAADPMGFPFRKTSNPEIANDQSLWTVFTMGGSTTFGYNVSDEHTWPSYLSQILNERVREAGDSGGVKVLNYGRSSYGISHELIFLIDLLKSGSRPHLVLFMDGINLGLDEDVGTYTKEVREAVHEMQFGSNRSLVTKLFSLPLFRLSRSIKGHLGLDQKTEGEKESEGDWQVDYVVERFVQAQVIVKALSEIYGFKPLFFLQPSGFCNYPYELYRREVPEEHINRGKRDRKIYERLRKHDSLIDLSELFEAYGKDRKALVDDLHYSPGFNRFVAEYVAKEIDLRMVPSTRRSFREGRTTGAPRTRE